VEWLQTDTNLVGCIERKARVIKAPSYEEALTTLSAEEAAGDWHFCRGVLDCESGLFKTYGEVDADPVMMYDARSGMAVNLAVVPAALGGQMLNVGALSVSGGGCAWMGGGCEGGGLALGCPVAHC